jgi:hypothetical protein
MKLSRTLFALTSFGIALNAFAVGGPLLNRTGGAETAATPFEINFSSKKHTQQIQVENFAGPSFEEPSNEDLEIQAEVSISSEPIETLPNSANEAIRLADLISAEQPPVAIERPAVSNGNLTTSLKAVGVKLSKSNRLAGYGEDEDLKTRSFIPRIWERMKFKHWDGAAGYSRKIRCNEFSGTHAGNKVYFKAEASGGSGHYIHSMIYTLNSSFESPEASGKQFEMSRKGNGKFMLHLPPLRDDVSYVQLTVLLLTRDLQNTRSVASQSLTFLVARPVILTVSNSLEAKQKECYERFLAYPSTMGILSNGSKNPSKIEIQQAIQNSWATTRGWQVGVFFAPFSFLTVGNLFFFNFSYFQQTTKKIVETVAVSTDFRLDPGEFMQIYTQPTRYITPYDATLVAACGHTQKVDGAYLFQWWGYSYIPFPIKPDLTHLPLLETIGAPAVNTCPPELTPMVGERAPGTYEFRSTI